MKITITIHSVCRTSVTCEHNMWPLNTKITLIVFPALFSMPILLPCDRNRESKKINAALLMSEQPAGHVSYQGRTPLNKKNQLWFVFWLASVNLRVFLSVRTNSEYQRWIHTVIFHVNAARLHWPKIRENERVVSLWWSHGWDYSSLFN